MAGATEPDPIRDKFTRGARILLDRAYARPGVWVGTRLANPGPAALAFMAELGIRWDGPDNVSAVGGRRGGLNARTRWARGFVRCLYHQHLYYAATQARGNGWLDERRLVALRTRALDVEIGNALPGGRQEGSVLVAGRAVRIRVRRANQAAADRAARRMRPGDRIWTDAAEPGARWSDPARRDWV